MNMIKVDKGVAIPPRRGGFETGGYGRYPWSAMAVGDSFFVKEDLRRVSGSVCYRQKKHGGKYTCRKVTENGVKGTRVWRIE